MSLLGGLAALAVAVAVLRLAARSVVLAATATVIALWLGPPACHSLGATVSELRQDVHGWQHERIQAGACYYGTIDALDQGLSDAGLAGCERR